MIVSTQACVLVSVLPDGELDLTDHVDTFTDALGTAWPEQDLWICAVRQRDLRRRVFGRDLTAPLAAAVSASCSIPGCRQVGHVSVQGD